tara:strand:- start:150 stop:344 length:195 start_codon:yes stop_codon:yes gene_type:complete
MQILKEPPPNAIQFSEPCITASESWIIENMVKDMVQAGKRHCVTRSRQKIKGQLRDVLILWKVL